jgi:hypothetical protein
MESKQASERREGVALAPRPAAFTVPEFCAAHRISRAMFYILARGGRGPRIMKCGRRTLVSAEAAAEWRSRMESATREAAP